jgi:hypothetical protein
MLGGRSNDQLRFIHSRNATDIFLSQEQQEPMMLDDDDDDDDDTDVMLIRVFGNKSAFLFKMRCYSREMEKMRARNPYSLVRAKPQILLNLRKPSGNVFSSSYVVPSIGQERYNASTLLE